MSDAQARELLAKADKKADQKGWFGGRKYDEAAELYERSANQFKLAKNWKEAGNAFLKAAAMYQQLNNPMDEDIAQAYISSSKCFKKANDLNQAVQGLSNAIAIFLQKGRFHAAASHKKEIAAIYESELLDYEKAMAAYEDAAEYYSSEDSKALANNCLLKVATFAAKLENYQKAIEIFESIATTSVDNQLTKWSIKEYFFKAGLCHLALDVGNTVGTRQAIERYLALDPSFSNTRECKLLNNIVSDVENEDLEGFTNHVAEYDHISQLDSWKTSLLLTEWIKAVAFGGKRYNTDNQRPNVMKPSQV
ncbi:Alpha-soluble NSF attachment protein, partial [Zancudomyces culisetae]